MEKLEHTGKWYKYGEVPPYLNKFLIVFRVSNKKYVIARCQNLKDENLIENDHWITQHGNAHDISPEDSWMGFEHITDIIKYE